MATHQPDSSRSSRPSDVKGTTYASPLCDELLTVAKTAVKTFHFLFPFHDFHQNLPTRSEDLNSYMILNFLKLSQEQNCQYRINLGATLSTYSYVVKDDDEEGETENVVTFLRYRHPEEGGKVRWEVRVTIPVPWPEGSQVAQELLKNSWKILSTVS